MPTLIRKLPLEDVRATISVAGQTVPVLPFQPIVWLSIAPKGPEPLDPRTVHLPAIVDLGFNGTFAIREEQLRGWAGLDPRLFPCVRSARLRGAAADLRLANVWLHPNVSKTRDVSEQQPFRMELPQGMFVLRQPEQRVQDQRPRLPLLGFRALHRADLYVTINCKNCRMSIRTAHRFWPFA